MGPVRDRTDEDSERPPAPARIERASGEAGTAPARESAEWAFVGDEAKTGEVDARAHAAWRSWLSALASDPKAAMAAALAYESLPASARDAWLEALDADAPGVRVPKVALYAPLLAVETDEERRARIERALQSGEDAEPPHAVAHHALRGTTPDGDSVCVVVSPLYLDFVELLVVRYGPGGITSARHEPLSHVRAQDALPEIDAARMELAPLEAVVEDLAHAVVADRRAGREPPEALQRYIHLFAPTLGGGGDRA